MESGEDAAHVCADIPCLGCGYNLKTLAVSSKCPECGRCVGESLSPVGQKLIRSLVASARALAWLPIVLVAVAVVFVVGSSPRSPFTAVGLVACALPFLLPA